MQNLEVQLNMEQNLRYMKLKVHQGDCFAPRQNEIVAIELGDWCSNQRGAEAVAAIK